MNLQNDFCGFVDDVMQILIHGVYEKFNITLRILSEWQQIKDYYKKYPVYNNLFFKLDNLHLIYIE